MQIKIKFPEKIRRILYRSTFDKNISVLIVNTDNKRFGRPHIIAEVSGLAGWAVRNRNISLAFARLAGLAVSLAFTLFDHDKEKYAAISTLTGPQDHSSEQFLTTILYLNDKRP